MVYSSGGIVGGDDNNSNSDVGGSNYWSERADLVLDSVSSSYSELVIFFFL